MSYDILYNTVCIKNDNAYLLCVLMGPNNVWEKTFKGERRARDWGVIGPGFMNLEQAQEWVSKMLSYGDVEHWKYKGKWVVGDAIKRWLDNNIKKAASLEDILIANCIGEIRVCAYKNDSSFTVDEDGYQYIHTNEEFSKWAEKVIAAKKAVHVDFPFEDVYMPEKFKDDDEVVFKKKSDYVTQYTDTSISFCNRVTEAVIMTYKNALNIKKKNNLLRDFKIVAKPVINPTSFVISIPSENGYAYKLTKSKLSVCVSKDAAYRYKTKTSAQNAVDRIRKRIPKLKDKELIIEEVQKLK